MAEDEVICWVGEQDIVVEKCCIGVGCDFCILDDVVVMIVVDIVFDFYCDYIVFWYWGCYDGVVVWCVGVFVVEDGDDGQVGMVRQFDEIVCCYVEC